MSYRIIGAIMVIAASSAVGFGMAAGHKRETAILQQLIRALEFMACEMEYRLTPLPELCRLTAQQVRGPIATLFLELEKELRMQMSADAYCCMTAALSHTEDLSERMRENLLLLGKNLGRFDLQGQLSGIASVQQLCRRDLEGMQSNQDVRLRSYRTLGICAGIALVILFI